MGHPSTKIGEKCVSHFRSKQISVTFLVENWNKNQKISLNNRYKKTSDYIVSEAPSPGWSHTGPVSLWTCSDQATRVVIPRTEPLSSRTQTVTLAWKGTDYIIFLFLSPAVDGQLWEILWWIAKIKWPLKNWFSSLWPKFPGSAKLPMTTWQCQVTNDCKVLECRDYINVSNEPWGDHNFPVEKSTYLNFLPPNLTWYHSDVLWHIG